MRVSVEDIPKSGTYPLVKLEPPFKDVRGVIQPLIDASIGSALIISSKRGTVRGNHYHKTDWHFCYLVSGRMRYHYRPAGSASKPKHVMVSAGEMFYTPPEVEHAMEFLHDTVFIVLSRNQRRQESYEADVIRVDLLSSIFPT